ncbi:hyaluronidase-2 [Ornithorhynchus anatinus]|uniref:Hyaluronidase n=1 Tax=Ornithorhynchus anatinus TaxID=9258 RepID=F6Y407_ORNAN|nr:hyaluronidase-2 [Ornithorhynchus anatinus]XP_028906727.1 hyaluronidase-2 [Ornithorhynchus anatinus]XP_028906728.1 hyaluronidase-2 [Ornithorhynchus anatinus]
MWTSGGPVLAVPWLLAVALAGPRSEEGKPTANPIFTRRPFQVAWNAPTQDCQPRFKVQLDFSVFDVQASPNEGFVDQNLTIFYRERLGLYPFYDTGSVAVHGGVPQNSSIEKHLDRLPDGVKRYIRSSEREGLAVIDWEDWRPVWIRNWQSKDVYRQASRQLVASMHPGWPADQVGKQAQYEFEFAARQFMLQTLRLAKDIRPRQLWGFYLFPDCYNHDYVQNRDSYTGHCPDVEVTRNDQLAWLWAESTAIYPSVYLEEALASSSTNVCKFVRSRVLEALRVAREHHPVYSLPVFVYTRPTYTRKLTGLSEMDLISTIGESAALGAAGIIFWGDTDYTKSRESCQSIKDYLEHKLAPYIANVTTAAQHCSLNLCLGHGRCQRRDSNTSTFLHLNPASFRLRHRANVGEPLLWFEGQLSSGDVAGLRLHFRCQCYQGWHGDKCQHNQSSRGGAGLGQGETSGLLALPALTLLAFTGAQ